jgi:hypothetical protein
MTASENFDLLFNLLFEFQMTLHDFHQQQNNSAETMTSLQRVADSAKYNVLQKHAHVMV